MEQLYRDRQQENKDKMAKLHATALKTVRALVKDRSNVEVNDGFNDNSSEIGAFAQSFALSSRVDIAALRLTHLHPSTNSLG